MQMNLTTVFTHTRLQELGFYFILFCLNLSSATLQIGSGQNKTKNPTKQHFSFSFLSGRTFPTESHEPGVFLPLHLSWVLIPCVQAFFGKRRFLRRSWRSAKTKVNCRWKTPRTLSRGLMRFRSRRLFLSFCFLRSNFWFGSSRLNPAVFKMISRARGVF